MSDERTLLTEYVTKGSDTAFREIVERYINLVYGTAVRLVDGDTHRAEDVVQMVFTDLARKAGALSREVMLGGWLHRRTCHVAASFMRSERRRLNRESEAMKEPQETAEAGFEQIAPFLDEAINQLGAEDRAAITLRFFEGRDLRSVGAALGSSEDAAQKRVARALEKLRALLARQGLTAGSTALTAMLSVQASAAAPAGLAATVCAAALANAATGGGLALTTLKLMSMAKIKIAVGTVVVAGLGTTLVLEHLALGRVREQNQRLELQVAQLRQNAAARLSSADSKAPGENASVVQQAQLRELSRLRGAVSSLRQEPDELAGLQAKNRELRAATDESNDPAEAEFKQQTEMRTSHLKQWGLSFLLYARDHGDQYPENFEEAAAVQGSEPLLGFDTNHFEIVYRGTTASVRAPDKTILFREKQARRSPRGDWVQVYGFADGHVEAHTEPDEAALAAWEQARIVAVPTVTNDSGRRP